MTNILITGGSRGIGYELVKQFAADLNNHIVVLSRNLDKLEQLKQQCEQLYKNTIHIYSIDFASSNFHHQFQDLLKKENKHFHIVINNAGVLINKPFTETTTTDWQTVFTINVFAPATIIKEVIHSNNTKEQTHVVNISSMGGFQGSVKFTGLSVYSASKAALANLTEVLAEEYKETNIKINCLALGAAQTEMLQEAFPDYQAPVSAKQMATYIKEFSLSGDKFFNGKILPVSVSTP
ncbi:MAG TPA: SDR family NAD(P)-dependent oxidoreductase [Vicingus sp.]|nr:SDR family NAD(P)-dependent oxidoreductase [Vicingus sp.]HRP60356.1 SDR family NAD(P)-dependent oxidoreductase [Vicingus sp.]